MSAARRIAVFARAPVAGEVKTRLHARLGPDGCACLQAQLIERALRKATVVAHASCELWVAGALDHPFIQAQAAAQRVVVHAQHGVDLGARMGFAVAHGGAAATVIIGTDCPALRSADIDAAFAALADHDVALIPATDGGYVLIGLRRPVAALFDAIDWGSVRVLAQTRARIAALGLRAQEFDPLPDLDLPADYEHAVRMGWIDAVRA